MPRRWLPILCAAVLVAGCGSSSRSDDASSATTASTASTATTATAPTTATPPTLSSAGLQRLPKAPQPTGAGLPATGGTTHNAFLRAVFDDVETLWRHEFRAAGMTYRPARLTIFTQRVDTACGPGSAGTGPFYCPASFGVYLDPTFFAALSRKVGVHLGGVAQAYVVAHEVAHHVQTLVGITRQRAIADHQDPAGANARSVRFELQADCLAGVWMHSVYRRGEITRTDLQDALNAAAVVGDDFQQSAAGVPRPREEWTHGSSAQRRRWLTTGFETGTPASCDTFDQREQTR